MSNVASNGHHANPSPTRERTTVNPVHTIEPTAVERVAGTLVDNFSPTVQRIEEGIRKHPKIAVASGLGLGVLLALVIRRLR